MNAILVESVECLLSDGNITRERIEAYVEEKRYWCLATDAECEEVIEHFDRMVR